MAGRPAIGRRLGAALRFLPQRAPAQDAAARGRASATVPRLPEHARQARRRSGAGSRVAAVRGAAAGSARIRASADARGRQRPAGRPKRAVLLRVRSRTHRRVGAGAALSAGSRHHAAGAGATGLQRAGRRRRSKALDARGARSLPRAPGDIQPPRRARPSGARRDHRRGRLFMIELGVNIDHVATLRQARRTYEPDPVWAAVEAHLGGADGITVHLREDRRHIQDQDVRRLRELVHIKLNLEMAATDEMVAIACELKPEMAMLVPEGRKEITTEGGLDVAAQEARLKSVVAKLADAGIMTSVFIDALPEQVHAAARIGARVCEIHTGPYAHAFHAKGRDRESAAVVAELAKIRDAGAAVRALGMRFNAGHALNYFNVQPVASLPGVSELHIGHAIVSRSLFVGLREAVRQMKALMREAAVLFE